MMVQHDDRAISHRQCWERSFEYPNRCDLRCSHDIRRVRNNSVGRHHVEIFVRPMRYKGCHQAQYAQVAICAFFTTPNPLKLQERRKTFLPISQSSCHIAKVVLALTAAKSPQRLTRGLAIPPAVSSLGGLRTPAPVCAAPPSWGRHPQTFTTPEVRSILYTAPPTIN